MGILLNIPKAIFYVLKKDSKVPPALPLSSYGISLGKPKPETVTIAFYDVSDTKCSAFVKPLYDLQK